MAGIIPLPSTRVSGALVRQRLLAQLQSDQLDLFRLQNQLSTGQRITLPSEDAPAARRAMTLQRLLERKDQLRTSVNTGQHYLQATDVALNGVAGLLGDLRGLALGAAGTTSTEAIRKEAVGEIDRALEELLRTANTQFRGRYLFAGSQTNVIPYSINGTQVEYHGDDRELSSFSDLGVLFGTNAAGIDVFGGISGEVLGGVDLNPQLAEDTPLSTLRGGRGLSANGALQISDGTNTVVVDLSRAVTVRDVIRMIEANPPAGRSVTASINGSGLTLKLDATGGGNLTVKEVGSGKTASELGILEITGAGTSPLVGSDLDPVILKTTRLDNLLGTKARTRLTSPGTDNDLLITAAANGAQYSGVTVQLVDDELLRSNAGVAPGGEYAQYDANARPASTALRFTGAGNDLTITANTAGVAYNDVEIVIESASIGAAANAAYNSTTKRLTITVDSGGATTVDDVVNAVNTTGVFTAAHDPSAEGTGTYNGAAPIDVADVGVVRGDTGNSGGEAKTLYVYAAAGRSTANQIAAAINAQGTFTAKLDTLDTSASNQAGNAVVSLHSTAVTAGGTGASFDKTGLRIVNGGETHVIDLSAATTVEDVLNILNGSEAGLHAELNADASGINIRSRFSGADFQIGENGGQTATQLGVRTFTGATRLDDLNHGVGVPTKRDSYQQSPPPIVPDFTIVADDGTATPVNLEIDVSSAETIQDVIDLINNHTSNHTGGVAVRAELNPVGNGIRLRDENGRPLTITAAEGSQAAEYLGLLPPDTTTVTQASGTITGTDRNYRETASVFTTLVRLKEAIAANDINAMNRAIEGIDADLERVTFARSEVGARQQSLQITQYNLEDEDVQLRSALSEEIEVDIVEAISNLTARQISLQASLQTTANILQMSLLNFL